MQMRKHAAGVRRRRDLVCDCVKGIERTRGEVGDRDDSASKNDNSYIDLTQQKTK